MEAKKQIRRDMLQRRKDCPAELRRQADKKIASAVFSLPQFQEAEEIYTYVSYREEASTRELIERALAEKKKVAVPKVLSPGHMEFYYIGSLMDVTPGYRGIPEPGKDAFVAEGKRGVILVPGLAFDRMGNRLGYGGGFYDAYLRAHPKLFRVGLFYSFQQREHVPTETFDMALEEIITEEGSQLCCQHCRKTPSSC